MLKVIILISFICVFNLSCSTDFNVTAPWKDITIVYGLLDASDTAQYVKVNKAFLDPTTSALTIAQNPDSLYYADLNVSLEEYQNGNLINTLQLIKVDGNSEGYSKDPGIFSNALNYLYKTTQTLNQNSQYKIIIGNENSSKVVSSITEVINDFRVIRPSVGQPVSLLPGFAFIVDWQSAENGKNYGLTIRFHYTEAQVSNPDAKQDKFIDWIIFTNEVEQTTEGGHEITRTIQSNDFYAKLLNAIPFDGNVIREAGKLDFFFSVGGEELYTFNQVTQAQQGLTSGQIEPQYTNIDNGLGLFSSRFNKAVYGIQIENKTLDSLACGSQTHTLHFKNSAGLTCF
ncbi:MAG: DUF4249 family protein [Chitinophagales bacterium]|nr:DUF4249 family protein [Chitinophagales bacterium]